MVGLAGAAGAGASALVCTQDFGGVQGAVRLKLGASPEAVRAALLRVGAELRAAGIPAEEASTAELVLAEALNNVVEHAFPAPSDNAWIELTVVPASVGIGCELRDNGLPMPRGALPCPSLPGLPALPCAQTLESLPEGGFGWFLIRTLARDLNYAREAGTNRLVLRIPPMARR